MLALPKRLMALLRGLWMKPTLEDAVSRFGATAKAKLSNPAV